MSEDSLSKVYCQLCKINIDSEDMITLLQKENTTYAQLMNKIEEIDSKMNDLINDMPNICPKERERWQPYLDSKAGGYKKYERKDYKLLPSLLKNKVYVYADIIYDLKEYWLAYQKNYTFMMYHIKLSKNVKEDIQEFIKDRCKKR